MLAGRLKGIMTTLISLFQSVFVPSRSIGDNIMLAQALCKNYHLHSGQPRYAIKLDIHKAFDSLNWDFIFNALRAMNFPHKFIAWLRVCVTSTMFSVKLNGSLEGYFKGLSGLRQGDSISPFLFVIAMEVLTAFLNKGASDPVFKFHWRMKDIKLHHIIFADDIFLFSYGNLESVSALMQGFNKFSYISGLVVNVDKSQCFYANVCDEVVQQILGEGFSSFIKFNIGPNSVFSFWHDPWANGKSLIHISDSIVSTAESTSMVPISVYLRNGVWDLPSSNHVDIIEVRNIVHSVQITRYDAIYWDGLLTRTIKISDIWNSIRTSNDLMPWADFVWNSFSIPKCSFITWLAILNILLTRDHMLMFGMQVDQVCVLCNIDRESIHHIFSECPYFDLVRKGLHFHFWEDWTNCIQGNFLTSHLKKADEKIASLFFTTAVYYTWKERNFRVHNPGASNPTLTIISTIRRIVKEKLFSSSLFQKWVGLNPALVKI
ncbi:uncharacterized protein LOC141702189 [Apium graveolens]|uniref:uncharacterized protein LOC141702189 n=1 Tax=Apium graveolens TaxID=4045 RepID=UPI003D7A2EF0